MKTGISLYFSSGMEKNRGMIKRRESMEYSIFLPPSTFLKKLESTTARIL